MRFIAVVFLLLPSFAGAGAFMAMPIRLFIDGHSRTEVLRITNQGNEKVTVQLDAKAWRQDAAGKDVYEMTKDIVFFPKIVDIEKGEERIVRIGYQGQNALTTEHTYRLFLEELPVTKPGELALKFSLRLSIPIFVKPMQEMRPEWAVDGLSLSEETLKFQVRNNGNIHLMVGKITAIGRDNSGKETFTGETTGWYILAGAARPFAMDFSRGECLRTGTVNVSVKANRDTRESTLDVEQHMCAPKQKGSKGAERDIRQ